MLQTFPGTCYARETLDSSAVAARPTLSVYKSIGADGYPVAPRYAIVVAETNPIRFTRNSPVVTPVDATPVGTLLPVGIANALTLTGENQIDSFRFVQNTGAGKVHFEYFR